MPLPKFSIGTDPELVCLHEDGSPIFVRDIIPVAGKFGADGHGFIAELRPDAAMSPKILVENTRESLAAGHLALGKYSWYAGPWIADKPLGGHLHFGVRATDGILDALRHQLGIMLALIEPPEQARTRRNTPLAGAGGGGFMNNRGVPYGLLGDYRDKPYGFEWRTPSSFIVSPGISQGIFALSKAIITEELVKGKSAFTKLPTATRRLLGFASEDFHNLNRQVFLDKLDTLWPILKNMKYFQEGNEGRPLWSSLQYLRRFAIAKEGFKTTDDLKSKWKITKTLANKIQQTQLRGDPDRATIPRNRRARVAETLVEDWGFNIRELNRLFEDAEIQARPQLRTPRFEIRNREGRGIGLNGQEATVQAPVAPNIEGRAITYNFTIEDDAANYTWATTNAAWDGLYNTGNT
jgi:hypothetical protein